MDVAAVARKFVQDPTQLGDDLAIWMQKCRWAGLSGLQYPKNYAVSIDLCQDFWCIGHSDPFLLLGITVTMQNLQDSRYFCLIFAFVQQKPKLEGSPAYPISTIFTPSIAKGQWTLQFATLDSIFVKTLLQMSTPTTILKRTDLILEYTPTNSGRISEQSIQGFKVLGGGDTTNSIIEVKTETPKGPQRFVFKSYLRFQHHNIEAEMITHLHRVGFTAVPALEGILTLKWGGRGTYTLLIVSQFVENEGDGGKPFWDHLQEYLHIIQTQKYMKSVLQKIGPLAQLVGQTTREFHNALAKTKTGVVQQEKVDVLDVTKWERELKENFNNATKLWAERHSLLFPHIPPGTLTEIAKDLATLADRVRSDFLLNTSLLPTQQPIHGDLHLGQFLFQPGPSPKFIVTDLEGDPQLPPERRRESRTVWFDLGGLLRALDYIAFFGTLESLKQQVPSHPWSAEDIFALFLVRLAAMPIPLALEQFRWAGESAVAHALEWAEFVGTHILRGYGLSEKLQDELPITFKLVRATSELNYELGFRGQNALVPLLGVLTLGNQWLKLKNTEKV